MSRAGAQIYQDPNAQQVQNAGTQNGQTQGQDVNGTQNGVNPQNGTYLPNGTYVPNWTLSPKWDLPTRMGLTNRME